MTSSFDLSDRTELRPLADLIAAWRSAGGTSAVVVIGAAARDLLLANVPGAIVRATEDTDLAFAVEDWNAFLSTREALIASGRFRPDRVPHRIWFETQRLDIVPFGGIERPDRTIEWPKPSVEVMNVWGLAEALTTSVRVLLPGGAHVQVASLPALALLKISAWKDRRHYTGKDASDLWLLMRFYAEAGNEDRLFGDEGLAAYTAYGFDIDRAGAWLLGRDARVVMEQGPDPARALEDLDAVLRPEIDPNGALRLVAQMPPGNRDQQLLLLASFRSGLVGEEPRR